jgi:sugar/nucleoside kinase (ribokinase family)
MSVELVTVGVVCADVMARPVEALPPRGHLALVDQLGMHLGGLAGVTAAVYARLGGTAAFVGRVGRDSFGEFLVGALRDAGVDTRGVARDDAAATSATVVVVSGDGERTFLHHIGANAVVTPADIDLGLFPGVRCLHWGGPGITPELEGAAMAGVYARARAAGIVTSMDTCHDGKGVWLPLIADSLPHLDIVFTSIEEARQYTGCHSTDEIAGFLRARGVGIVVIKLGAEGLIVASEEGTLALPAHCVRVVDTTGAGDAACAGFLYGHLRGWSLRDCGRLANAVGGLTVQVMGGSGGVASLAAVQEFMETASCGC